MSHIIGRVAVDRAIRLRPALVEVRGDPPAPAGIVCKSCGEVICEAGRAKLFAGMVLRCNGCGASTRG